MKWFLGATLIACGVLFTACDSLDGGPRKIIINEAVCTDVGFLRMNLGEETEIVVDNTNHSEAQEGMTVLLEEFPVTVTGELPPNSQVGADFTTLRLSALPGEEQSVEVRPIYTGQFTGTCGLQIASNGGGTVLQQGLTFEIVDN